MYVVYATDPSTAQKYTRLQINNIIDNWAGGYDCQANGDSETININVFSECDDNIKDIWLTHVCVFLSVILQTIDFVR